VTTFVCRRTGRTYGIGAPLDRDGQAAVHDVEPASAGLALKRYRPDTLRRRPELESRVKAMLATPAPYRTGGSDPVVYAWPEDAAYVEGQFVGYVMPRVDTRAARTVHDVATSPDATWRDRVVVAENLARAVAGLHEADVVVGSLRDRNVLAGDDGRVTLLGCDRMQVEDPGSGRRFACVTDHDACTPPELLLASTTGTLRTRSSDVFPLAVLLHVLLLPGAHPFRGVWRGDGDRPAEQELARDGLWCYGGDRRLDPEPGAPPLDVLPAALQSCFWGAFVDGARHPAARPPAQEWVDALADLRASLATCPRDATHAFGGHATRCPWCPPGTASADATPPGYLPWQAPAPPAGPSGPAPAPRGTTTVRIDPRRPAPERAGPERVGPERVGPERVGPERVGPERVGTASTPPPTRPDTASTPPPTRPDTAPPPAHRPRTALRAAAWAVAAVVGLGVVAGVARSAERPGPAVAGSAVTVPVTSAPVPAGRPADPTAALQLIRTQDAAAVEGLADSWVAQLSTRPAATREADRAAADAAVLAGHDALRRRHPDALLLWSADWNYDGRSWITVVDRRFATPEEANGWCDAQGLAGQDCFAKRLSRSGAVDGSARYRR
jgi:hypothetical protein